MITFAMLARDAAPGPWPSAMGTMAATTISRSVASAPSETSAPAAAEDEVVASEVGGGVPAGLAAANPFGDAALEPPTAPEAATEAAGGNGDEDLFGELFSDEEKKKEAIA